MTQAEFNSALKKYIPDIALRVEVERYSSINLCTPEIVKTMIYHRIAYCSYIKHIEPTFLIVWNTPQGIEAGLKLYEHTADWLYWLLEQIMQDDFAEGALIVQKEIERRGFNRQSVTERFDL